MSLGELGGFEMVQAESNTLANTNIETATGNSAVKIASRIQKDRTRQHGLYKRVHVVKQRHCGI